MAFVDCKCCANSRMDGFRGILMCTKLNCYCHYHECETGKELTTRMIPEVGEDKCPGMKTRTAHVED